MFFGMAAIGRRGLLHALCRQDPSLFANYYGWPPFFRRASALASSATKKAVEFVVSACRARDVASELLDAMYVLPDDHRARNGRGIAATDAVVLETDGPAVALDCEGVRLGRFGRICMAQLAVSDGRVFLFDALRPGIIEALGELLESEHVAKVLHDCREDSAALWHQHGLRLRAVFDTQAAHAALERCSGRVPYQSSIAELLRTKLGVADAPEVAEVKSLMSDDDKLWTRRPLNGALVRYALHGVTHLLQLRIALLSEAAAAGATYARTVSGGFARTSCAMAHASCQAAQYRYLNSEYSSAEAMAKIGTRLWALVVARTCTGLFFKLNAGRIGVVSTPSALSRFDDVQPGDAALCCVSGVSLDGSYLYLDRYDHDWDYFDHQLRPSGVPEVGAYGREHRHKSSLFVDPATSDVDPLLSRGLPASEGLHDEEGSRLDAWEAGPEDLGLHAEDDL